MLSSREAGFLRLLVTWSHPWTSRVGSRVAWLPCLITNLLLLRILIWILTKRSIWLKRYTNLICNRLQCRRETGLLWCRMNLLRLSLEYWLSVMVVTLLIHLQMKWIYPEKLTEITSSVYPRVPQLVTKMDTRHCTRLEKSRTLLSLYFSGSQPQIKV